MKLKVTKEQRLRTQRVMQRVKKMCKYALLVLFVNYIASSAVFQVIKEQVIGNVEYMDGIEEMQTETAFVDKYGDFEELVQRRRDKQMMNRATILYTARAQQITDFKNRGITTYKIAPIQKYVAKEEVERYSASDDKIEQLNKGMKQPGQVKEDEYDWTDYIVDVQAQGYIEEFYKNQRCTSAIIVPGTSLLGNGLMGAVYLVWLFYLFVGIGIISDIFMESIESITAQTKKYEYFDDNCEHVTIEVAIWNETVANLTLMALGSSAPEILLSVISTLKDIEAVPPELGPSTIVGSASFNLLVISAVSIIAVGGEDNEVKMIADLWVFAVTTIFSLWAYIWMWICVADSYVSVVEGIMTIVFFVLLITISFAADKLNKYRMSQHISEEEQEERVKQEENKLRKDKLRSLSREFSEKAVIEVAQGLPAKESIGMTDDQKKDIKRLFGEIFMTSEVKDIPIQEMMHTLQHDSLLERFAYRKRDSNQKDFIRIKGTKGGQLDHDEQARKHVKVENDVVGFKCLHYSVTESNGHVEVTVVKKKLNQEMLIGVRTRDDTAVSPKDYKEINQHLQFGIRDVELKIEIPIVDDDEWNPDLEFWVELFDPVKQEQGLDDRLPGDDTRCKVTILDEDFPGTIQFGETDVRVPKGATEVEIEIERVDGSDGNIGCMISTEPLTIEPSPQSAQEFEHYLPKHEKITFKHSERSQTVIIKLVNEKLGGDEEVKEFKDNDNDNDNLIDEQGSEEEEPDLIFKVKLDKPEPMGVKISKKNVCLVTLVRNEEEDKLAESQRKLISMYLALQEPTFSMQFKNAVMLGPIIDDEENEITDVDLYEAMCHFLQIGWKLAFATVPPAPWYGGAPCFLVSLAYIGVVTYVVGEVATVLGCVLYIKESVAAITLVALGTSLPDTFASMTAARQSESADAAVGNINGSNAVNVFLGCGLPWAIGSIYWTSNNTRNNGGQGYEVKSGPLAFSVVVFLCVALICFIVIVARRALVGGELGGSPLGRYLSGSFLIFLWFVYILMSTLQAYGIIDTESS